MFHLNSNWFLTALLLNICFRQNALELQCSNFALRFLELHVMALTKSFTSIEMFKLALVLFGAEALWCFNTQYLVLYLFAVGRKMTLLEVE